MTTISVERIAQIEASLFPGEGRGPVTRRCASSVPLRYIDLPDWTPAFAGERLEGLALA
jgi:hypothetical protein